MILLIEDNDSLVDGLVYSFREKGYDIRAVKTLEDAKNNINKVDLIILDVTLPDGDGFTFYKDYIKGNIKTIFLTAKDTEIDIVTGLKLGAEDYITKPFFISELLLRVEKILNKKTIVKVKNITFDIEKQEVYKNDKIINLTSLELMILEILFININKTIKRELLLDKLWEYTGNDVDDHTLTVYIKRIKDKLDGDYVKTIKGIGYRIDE